MNTDIELYTTTEGVSVEIRYEAETIWATQREMAELFQTTPQNITLHLKKVYQEAEIEMSSTCKEYLQVQIEGKRSIKRVQKFYNLDAILSVGYRVNSKRGTQFRIWATKVLKEKLLENVTQTNSSVELTNVVKYIARITEGKALGNEETVGLLQVITDYSRALELLDKYDHQKLELNTGNEPAATLTVEEVRKLVAEMNEQYGSGNLFGKEKDRSLESSVASIFQTFEGKELYPTPEIKAANLLYFLTKNHSFVDGNKRIAAATFIYYLNKNNLLYREYGMKRIDNNTLVALTLLLAESNPNDREMLVKVIVNLL